MVLVVEAPTGSLHVFEVHLALVADTVHIGGARAPADRGHRAPGLTVPAPHVRHLAHLTLPTCT